jgi:hypothetical protein
MITCDQFKAITTREVTDCTVAECAAARNHYCECAPCREAMDLAATRIAKMMTPLEKAACNFLADQQVRKCLSDPEF